MGKLLAIAIACGGCTTVHESTLPPYVRDLKFTAGRIDMIQCRINYKKETHHTFIQGSTTSTSLEDGPCWMTPVSTVVTGQPPAPVVAP